MERCIIRYCEKNTGSTSKSSHKVTGHRQCTDTSTTKSGSCRDNSLEFLVHALFTVAGHNQSLVLELFGDIPWSRAGNFDPGLREKSTGDQHENEIANGVDRVQEGFLEVEWRRHIVGNTRGSIELSRATLTRFPNTKKLDKDVVREARVQHLTD